MQLYYMSKDGNRGSDSTVVLMTVAVVYKFVLVILGAAILLFWYRPLYSELGKFFPLYLFGLLLNVILVVVIAGIMLMPNIMLRLSLIHIYKTLFRVPAYFLLPECHLQESFLRRQKYDLRLY